MDDGLHQSDYRELSPVSLWTDTSVQWSTDMFMWISPAEAPSIPAPVRTTSPVSSALSSPVSVRTTAAGAFSQAITRLFSGQQTCSCGFHQQKLNKPQFGGSSGAAAKLNMNMGTKVVQLLPSLPL
ncbi:hypothetical protein DPEC_G00068500 [Dallia pectoralis]|uniref:Uncharacterized protein n=1 Tax=Dallia pectoralis TaxID=75939 RepID=A0ACC2H1E1_DALPE|nr:hypothetical protein DPEC_G00068500 [Dallia pectoralis]